MSARCNKESIIWLKINMFRGLLGVEFKNFFENFASWTPLAQENLCRNSILHVKPVEVQLLKIIPFFQSLFHKWLLLLQITHYRIMEEEKNEFMFKHYDTILMVNYISKISL